MTKGQQKTLRKNFNCLDFFLKSLKTQAHIKNPDIVEETRLNIKSEINRLIEVENESKTKM